MMLKAAIDSSGNIESVIGYAVSSGHLTLPIIK